MPNYDEHEFLKHLKPVSPDDEFCFRCSCCADCCKHIESAVALETLDIFNLSRFLKQSGSGVWRIEEILEKYATLLPLTDFGYPMFFINTVGADNSCVFLESGRCGIHSGKPRTCRMYPLTAEPVNCPERFKYHLITERTHHFTGPKIVVGNWMADALNKEDREFTETEIAAAIRIGRLMQEKQAGGIGIKRILSAILFYKYIDFDVDKPFIPQYLHNISRLIHVLENMK